MVKESDRTIRPKVSVIAISYNHEKYIRQAFDSFLEQKTDFDFEVVVGDDCSTDRTPEIIAEYIKNYPDIFRLVPRRKNVGIQQNYTDTMNFAQGKYLALCECDDYWTDPQKLQRQVDYMDNHDDAALCFHPVRVFYENDPEKTTIFPDTSKALKFTLENLLKQNYIQTNSVLYVRQSSYSIPKNILPVDWYLHLYHAQFGKIGFINQVMSAYRRHEGGVWWASDNHEFWKKNGIRHLDMYRAVLELYGRNKNFADRIYEPIIQAFREIAGIPVAAHDDPLGNAVKQFPKMAANFIRKTHANYENQLRDQDIMIAGQKARIKILEKQASDQSIEQQSLHRQNVELRAELKTIKDSKGWRIYKAIQKAKGIFRTSTDNTSPKE